MNTQALWYLSRGTGIVALLLLTAAVVLGMLNSGRFLSQRWPRFTVSAIHRNISLLALVFLVIHIASSVIDPYAGIRWLDAVVPFVSSYRSFWLGLGALSGDLMLAVLVTSLLRPRIGYRVWRAVHWLSYAMWPIALVHGIGTGITDDQVSWVLLCDGVCALAVLGALWWRLGATHADTEARTR
jgi:sulfoxide reductase heme-binding subunit YedZ